MQKAGTSWWFRMIQAHPGVVRSARKEHHFFTRYWQEPFGDDDILRYHQWFPRPAGHIIGEWTPTYLYQHWTPSLLQRAAPSARILVMLRDPVERYQSGLTHNAVVQTLKPMDAVDAFFRGLYSAQLEWMNRVYPPSQTLVLQYERCRANRTTELARTFAFLGLDNTTVDAPFDERVNIKSIAKVPLTGHRREELVELYSDDVKELAQRVPDLDLTLWPNFRHLA